MSQIYNVYCDESCHLENDHQPIMVQGALWCEKSEVPRLVQELKDIKNRHNAKGELKWVKVSSSRLAFYEKVVDWFLSESPLHFRALVVTNKQKLDHTKYNFGSHDEFYYKMYFSLLNKILSPDDSYHIYLDIKDTQSRLKVRKLCDILCNDKYDFTGQMIQHIQNIHSNESELMQLADLLIGAVSYRQRDLAGNKAKCAVVKRLEERLGRTLLISTPLWEKKFNLFLFKPRVEE